MHEGLFDNGTTTGTIGGTMLSILPVISGQDLIKTMLLATIGAVVSYFVSLLLKKVFQRKQNKRIH